MATRRTQALYRSQELAFRTQYAELKERSRSAGLLLPGAPGSLALREGTGYGYWYRRYYLLPGQEIEDLVCKAGEDDVLEQMRQRIDFSAWSWQQARSLRALGFQVADKDVACVLVELHNKGLFSGGMVVVGTLAFMAMLNEFGAVAVSPRTQDVDLARRQALKLAAPVSFLETLEGTRLKFFAVPGMPNQARSTSVKRPGKEGLRVDVLTPGKVLGQAVPVSELQWHAQAVPQYGYLLQAPQQAAVLAGGHCIPVSLPQPERFAWHKLFSSAKRVNEPEKAKKDLVQAATLLALLAEQDDVVLAESFKAAPAEVRTAAKARLPVLRGLLQAHPQTLEQVERALA